jgi:hypothetical protein
VSERTRQDVFQLEIWSAMALGKSLPLSMIQETLRDRRCGEKRRAPSAEYDPAPPRISKTACLGGR